MSLEALLEAAKILQDQDRGSLYPPPHKFRERKGTRRSQTYRATHNQLEKNRRAHLRDCLTSLRDLVPTSPDQTKATTLSLLQSAKQYIKVLEVHDKEAQIIKKRLYGEQQKLRRKLSTLLSGSSPEETPSKVRKLDTDEIDVENDDETGYGSGDDRSSTDSSGSH
ncbi:max dimerization protein 1-like [Rhopilema esculentum]|uniref:max dimerization protein 1-like n=1 Tax=Rhopilema esculentum TaxID=499914 RepID=UPI0031D344CE|eukprot:gene11897-2456_t